MIQKGFSITVVGMLSLILLLALVAINDVGRPVSNTIRVPADYPTIQSAINAGSLGDSIIVAPGIYYEHVVVNKTVSLIGKANGSTVIDGEGKGIVVAINASNVDLCGFTIRHSGQDSRTDSGVFLMFGSTNGNVSNNVVIDNYHGIFLEAAMDNVVSSNTISSNTGKGIFLESSSGNIFSANVISHNKQDNGVELFDSTGNSITANNIASNGWAGIYLVESPGNMITSNIVFNNSEVGIFVETSSNNVFYHNTLVSNGVNEQGQIYSSASLNMWDNGAEGNFWSDYDGADVKSGPDQNEPGSDGIGDTPYNITVTDRDRYPLMEPWSSVRFFYVEGQIVAILSNSTRIADFSFESSLSQMSFNITGTSGALGFCNVTIPKSLLNSDPPGNWAVSFDETYLTFTMSENSTHNSLYFTYVHRAKRIWIRVIAPPQNHPPYADFSYFPTAPTPYDFIQFTDSSTDSDGIIISRYWQFGDGDSSSEQNPSHRYAYAGTYIATLKVKDNQTAETETAKAVTVRKVKTALTVTAPSAFSHADLFAITATLKDENLVGVPGVNIEIYVMQERWERIGSGETNATGTASIVHASFLGIGLYRFKALFNGTSILEESSYIFAIEFLDVESPIANAGGDQTVYVNILVVFDATDSSDNVGIVTYNWDFGDGTAGTGVTTNHSYTSPGKFTVTLTVKDAGGNTGVDSVVITVLAAEVFPIWRVGLILVIVGVALAAAVLLRRRRLKDKQNGL